MVRDLEAEEIMDRFERPRLSRRDADAQIATLFGEGNFEIPMFVHAQKPPGAEVMAQMKASIVYRYEEMETGGRVRITTTEPQALKAVHDFLRFQIADHRTGDPTEVKEG